MLSSERCPPLCRQTVRYLVETGYIPAREYLRLARAGAFNPPPVDSRALQQFQAPLRAYAQPMQGI
jgi:hypothetical protein